MTERLIIVCLIIIGLLGLVGAAGGIYLISLGNVSEGQSALVFSLGTGALTGVLGFMTGRAVAKIDAPA